MPFVVTENCIDCKHTDCVDVCPMNCFVEGPNILVIDPAGCIDCSVCVPECPVDAIVNAREVSADQAVFVALNAELARDPSWRAITSSRSPLAGHEAAARLSSTSDKLARLQRTW